MPVTDGIRLIDQHCHGVQASDPTMEDFEEGLTEGGVGRNRWHSMLGQAVRRWCAPVLDLPPHANPTDYLSRRQEIGWREVTKRLLTAAGVDHWFVDTGYATETTPQDLAELSNAQAHEVLRIEQVAENTEADSPKERLEKIRENLRARARNAIALKTIIGYRSGLAIPPDQPTEAEAKRAAENWHGRLTDPTLHAWLVHEAAQLGLPLQFHTGFGDPDLHLHHVDPALLTDFVRARPDLDVVLLHCWPYHRNAAYLAHVFDNVSVDIGLTVPFVGARTADVIAETLEIAPFESVRYSSDGNVLPELHYLGAVLWRHHFGRLLDDWISDGVLTAADAERLANDVGAGNTARSTPHLLGDLHDQR